MDGYYAAAVVAGIGSGMHVPPVFAGMPAAMLRLVVWSWPGQSIFPGCICDLERLWVYPCSYDLNVSWEHNLSVVMMVFLMREIFSGQSLAKWPKPCDSYNTVHQDSGDQYDLSCCTNKTSVIIWHHVHCRGWQGSCNLLCQFWASPAVWWPLRRIWGSFAYTFAVILCTSWRPLTKMHIVAVLLLKSELLASILKWCT